MNPPVDNVVTPRLGERVPPYSYEAEVAVLGAMLLDKTAIARAIEILDDGSFHHSGHRLIFQGLVRLFERSEAVDLLTLGEELRRRGQLEAAGGELYLTEILEAVPTAANIEYHARIVLAKAIHRRLIEAATDIITDSYREKADPEELVDRAEQRIFSISEMRYREGFVPLKQLLHGTFDLIEKLHQRKGHITGVPTGFTDLDNLTAGLQKAELIVIAGRPSMGKTSLALNVAQHAGIEGRIPLAIFSLEMSKHQLVQRLLCSEAEVNASKLRTGYLSEADWPRLAAAAGVLAEAPIYIDDTAALSALEMRAKARRLRSEIDLGLIIVDYLQLMQGPRDAENRQQAISAISRSLKALAKELNVPVVALSQLSRAPEMRADKRPTLADLRECLAGDTLLTDAATGERRTIAEMFAEGRRARVFSLGPDSKLRKSTAAAIVRSGEKEVFLLRTGSGREVRASANHPFLTINGWRRLDSLALGTEIAVPRILPASGDPSALDADRARLLGYLISDGSYIRHRAVSFSTLDREALEDVRRICQRQFGFGPRDKGHWSGTLQLNLSDRGQYGPGKNPLIEWLKSLGIHEDMTPRKRVPAPVFSATPGIIEQFLAGLYSGDGSIVRRADRFVIKCTSTSHRLLREAQSLLLRLGILSTLGPPRRNTKSTVDIAELVVEGKEQVASFARSVPLIGAKGRRLAEAARWSATARTNPRWDRLPLQVEAAVGSLERARGLSWRSLGYRFQAKRIGRNRLLAVAAKLEEPVLAALEASDVLWDPVVEIVPVGREMTYDLAIPETHNFVADDVIVHNSGAIEQDADLVLFIYREDQYNPQSHRAGIAEIIVGKQRNGPTGKVELVFIKEYTRFQSYTPRAEPPA